jgi:hypothetical protein
MNKWLLIFIVVINIIVCLYSVAPNFVTFAEVYPENIAYNLDDISSINQAIIKAQVDGLYSGVKLAGEGSFLLSGLVIIDMIILLYINFFCKRNIRKRPNKSEETNNLP